MTTSRRVEQAPAWVLHHRPFRDTSRILDILSREHGRLSLVARGSRAAKSRLRGILRPFTALSLSWVSRSDLGTLTGAELTQAPLTLSGDALMSAYYVNELLLKLLHKHDPQPGIFDIYSDVINELAAGSDVAGSLRQFEMELLRMLGYELNLQHDAESHEELVADQYYDYRPGQGPVPVTDSHGNRGFTGAELIAISKQDFEQKDVLRNAGRLLRDVVAYHLDGKELKSRKVMMELRQSDRKTNDQEELS
jgi:DNA repair protein RecO (recombination protein O)